MAGSANGSQHILTNLPLPHLTPLAPRAVSVEGVDDVQLPQAAAAAAEEDPPLSGAIETPTIPSSRDDPSSAHDQLSNGSDNSGSIPQPTVEEGGVGLENGGSQSPVQHSHRKSAGPKSAAADSSSIDEESQELADAAPSARTTPTKRKPARTMTAALM